MGRVLDIFIIWAERAQPSDWPLDWHINQTGEQTEREHEIIMLTHSNYRDHGRPRWEGTQPAKSYGYVLATFNQSLILIATVTGPFTSIVHYVYPSRRLSSNISTVAH